MKLYSFSLTTCTTLLLFILFNCKTIAQTDFDGKGIVGQWRVVDVKTDEEKRIMEIWENDGMYHAKIVKISGMNTDEAAKELCSNCPDERKGKKLLGMQLISNLKKGTDKYSEGEILDLIKGKVYKCTMWLENQDRLKVRTQIPLIFKDEVWFRHN